MTMLACAALGVGILRKGTWEEMDENSKHKIAAKSTSVFMAYQETKGFLSKYLRRFYSNSQDIEDAIQESFLKTFEIEKRQTIENPEAYLFMTANNFARRDLKKKSNTSTEAIEDIELSRLSIGMKAVEQSMEARQTLAIFCEAADTLPSQCRRAFLLRKVYGFSQKEIAATMEISVSTVEKHLAKGLMRSVEFMAKRGAVVAPKATSTRGASEDKK
jgi:RNA polymerase sigma factor (sigma-70 family)